MSDAAPSLGYPPRRQSRAARSPIDVPRTAVAGGPAWPASYRTGTWSLVMGLALCKLRLVRLICPLVPLAGAVVFDWLIPCVSPWHGAKAQRAPY